MTGDELRDAYVKDEMCGWAEKRHPGLFREQFKLISEAGGIKDRLVITGNKRSAKGKKTMLYQVTRRLLGKDTLNYAQEIGDCVSQGAKNAAEYLQACEILLKGDNEKWRPVFAPYYYGTGRVYVGKGRLGNGDGSLGSWMAEAVQKYGTLFSDDENVPKYSGRVASAWGDPNPKNDLDKFKPVAIKRLVRSAAVIRSWDDLVEAIGNGYPCPTASMIGYNMTASADGFHRQTEEWAHQMCIIGADDNDKDPYGIILNSWGDAHGHLKDFDDGHDLPVGVLRVRRKDIEKHIREGETYAYSNFDGFPGQDLDKALFDLIGN